jgi:CheY-like chemotaxis protein
LERAAPHFEVYTVRTGGQAISYLDRLPPFVGATRPTFIVLDFKLPDMTATEVLEHIATRDELRPIPVLVLTQAVWHDEKQRALASGAGEFMVKPSGLQSLRDVLASFRRRHVHAGQSPAR